MNNHKLLDFYFKELKKNSNLIKEIHSLTKDQFSKNENMIAFSVSLLKLSDDIYSNMDQELFALNPDLFNLFVPIHEYSHKCLNKFGLLNTYKLHDFICVDLINIKNFLSNILGEK